jgi:hypothetical protein
MKKASLPEDRKMPDRKLAAEDQKQNTEHGSVLMECWLLLISK